MSTPLPTGKFREHAVALRQCSILLPPGPIQTAMLEAADFLAGSPDTLRMLTEEVRWRYSNYQHERDNGSSMEAQDDAEVAYKQAIINFETYIGLTYGELKETLW